MLTQTRPSLDPTDLAQAIERQVHEPDFDYRTRLLVHEASLALQNFWGVDRFQQWLKTAQGAPVIRACVEEEFEEVGFPSLPKRVQMATKPEDIKQFLRLIGGQLTTPVRVVIGGSSSLILAGLIHRQTEDVDVVDEVPQAIRELHSSLSKLQDEYALVLAHFQSHYLPRGWESRLTSQGSFGRMEVYTVDPLDVAVGKLMSRRDKDRTDLRVLARHFSKSEFTERLAECRNHFQDEKLLQSAKHNWYVLFGEDLPD